jgi:hypothetical protein
VPCGIKRFNEGGVQRLELLQRVGMLKLEVREAELHLKLRLNKILPRFALLNVNWLRVLDAAEGAQVDQRVCHHLHAIMPLLDAFKTAQQPFERIFPGKGALDAHP